MPSSGPGVVEWVGREEVGEGGGVVVRTDDLTPCVSPYEGGGGGGTDGVC